jgi:hypothetical protein
MYGPRRTDDGLSLVQAESKSTISDAATRTTMKRRYTRSLDGILDGEQRPHPPRLRHPTSPVVRCYADNPCAGHRSPKAAIVGFTSVISHQEPVVGWNLDWNRETALWAFAHTGEGLARADKLVRAVALAIHMAVANVNFITRSSNDTLNGFDFRLCTHRRITGRTASPDDVRHRPALLRHIASRGMNDHNISHSR